MVYMNVRVSRPKGQSLSKITSIFQISVANFKFPLHFMQVSYFRPFCISNFVTNFIEILIVWCSCDVLELVKFLKIEKRMRLMRLVCLNIQKISTRKHT